MINPIITGIHQWNIQFNLWCRGLLGRTPHDPNIQMFCFPYVSDLFVCSGQILGQLYGCTMGSIVKLCWLVMGKKLQSLRFASKAPPSLLILAELLSPIESVWQTHRGTAGLFRVVEWSGIIYDCCSNCGFRLSNEAKQNANSGSGDSQH